MTIRMRPEALLDAPPADVLAFTSANGVRAYAAAGGGALPVYAVGAASAAAARKAGLPIAGVAEGDVASLAALIARARPGRVLHVSGVQAAGDLAASLTQAGVSASRAVLYEAAPALTLPRAATTAIRDGLAFVLLYSPRSARLLARLVEEAGIRSGLSATRCVALSAAVAEAARSLPFADVIVPPTPDDSGFVDILSGASS
ncbi:uroporphyrinogen-III synthase [Parvularcula dongshanensis]|uniref:Uroporphyrinogen-III synthase n=2 Tax=Parvularcula dongshanensis TaxID=1173995 RepID=A0A840I0C2_9PROT|nr:uroporphyrinogen-III synthase [Parvularcula dongshanensis]